MPTIVNPGKPGDTKPRVYKWKIGGSQKEILTIYDSRVAEAMKPNTCTIYIDVSGTNTAGLAGRLSNPQQLGFSYISVPIVNTYTFQARNVKGAIR